MEWSDLHVFLAVARAGTLGAAARNLGQTQPTMGRRLRALELAVGHKLFLRTTDGFVLTDEGRAVRAHAERMEEEALAIQRELTGAEAELEGKLRLSSSEWFGAFMLAPVLAEFGKRHPKVCVELLTDARLYSLPRREADLVFRIRPFDEPEVIARRQASRPGHFMPASLLASQFETLEPLDDDEPGVTIDVDQSIDTIVEDYVSSTTGENE